MTKILLIDDEKDFCYYVKENLQLISNYEVITAPNGKEGIKTARKNKPDLILLDITMPKMNGFEALKELKKDDQTTTIPIIILTAKGNDETKIEATSLSCEDYLAKPVEASVLKSTIEKVLTRRHGNRTSW